MSITPSSINDLFDSLVSGASQLSSMPESAAPSAVARIVGALKMYASVAGYVRAGVNARGVTAADIRDLTWIAASLRVLRDDNWLHDQMKDVRLVYPKAARIAPLNGVNPPNLISYTDYLNRLVVAATAQIVPEGLSHHVAAAE